MTRRDFSGRDRINNAANTISDAREGDYRITHWQNHMDLNLDSVFYYWRSFEQRMLTGGILIGDGGYSCR